VRGRGDVPIDIKWIIATFYRATRYSAKRGRPSVRLPVCNVGGSGSHYVGNL